MFVTSGKGIHREMLSGIDAKSDQHQRDDDKDEPLSQSTSDDGVQHLLASLDGVLLALVVQVECTIGHNVFVLLDPARARLGGRSLPRPASPRVANIFDATLDEDVVLVLLTDYGRIRNGELCVSLRPVNFMLASSFGFSRPVGFAISMRTSTVRVRRIHDRGDKDELALDVFLR